MRIFTILGILFYAGLAILLGLFLIVFSLNILQLQDIINLFTYALAGPQAKLVLGLCGMLLVLISFSFAQLILGKFQRERTIAFNTSSGEVTIALSAVEDLIRRLTNVIPEIKELRPNVVASKNGILVDLRVILKTEANIPELTNRLQDIARARIQEVLGIEEEIIIKIHVAKIVAKEEKEKKKKDSEQADTVIPFSGYGRT